MELVDTTDLKSVDRKVVLVRVRQRAPPNIKISMTHPHRIRKTYGRRKGRPISKYQQGLLHTLLPEVTLDLRPEALQTLFKSQKGRICLEIGFGAGEHLAHVAKSNPGDLFLGGEIFINGVASLLRHMDQQDISNIRIYPDDARELLKALPTGSLDQIYLLYPDPWRKSRHAERRFLQQETLQQFWDLLKPGGKLLLASDDPLMITWMEEQVTNFAKFTIDPDENKELTAPPQQWIQTRYESKAVQEKRTSHYFKLLKKG